MTPRVLLVDDAKESRESLSRWLATKGFDAVRAVGTLRLARERITEEGCDLLLLEPALPDGDGLELLERPEGDTPEAIVITRQGTVDAAVRAMRAGAVDYLTQPLELPRLERLLDGLRSFERPTGTVRLGRFGKIIGVSEPMRTVCEQVARVAPTPTTVLITGETGTGKELVAQALHELSPRRREPFLAVNCGALPSELIESELFGHEKGSFTGADRRHRGIFERVDGGTLFLDEITEMPLDLQVKLLRVLESRSVMRIGGDSLLQIDVRLVAASNQDVLQAVQQGKFRQDLYYRLNVFQIHLPPLRERSDDVEILCKHFLPQHNAEAGTRKRFTRAALDRMRLHAWPGNVRELRNVIERAFIISGSEEEIDVDAVLECTGGLARTEPAETQRAIPLEPGMSIAEAERRLILSTLDRLEWNKRGAADELGISLKTLYNRLNAYGVKPGAQHRVA